MVVDDGRPTLQYVCVFGGQVENLPVRKVDVATIGLVVLRVGRRLRRAEQAKVR